MSNEDKLPVMPTDVEAMIKNKRDKKKKDKKKKNILEKDDIESTKKVFVLAGELSIYITHAVKKGFNISDLFYLMQIASKVMAIVAESKMILPELKDLDKPEAEELTGMLYDYVKEIIDLVSDKEK